MLREVRSFKKSELRVESVKDGKRYLVGYAATFNTLSNDMGGWRERIRPGAFARAIAEKQDVRHTVNHALNNALVLGRTAAGTTEIQEDRIGLAFRTLINEEDPEAIAFAARVKRGDINENSFAFYVHGKDGQAWEGDVRELRDLDIDDISTVIYAAYPGTSANVAMRAMLPDGMPAELRRRILALGRFTGGHVLLKAPPAPVSAAIGEEIAVNSRPGGHGRKHEERDADRARLVRVIAALAEF